MLERAKAWARRVRADVVALYLALGDDRVPWVAKAVAAAVVIYALSPIDLIPDFIPVLGLVDDVLLVPLGIALAVRLVPREVMAELRARAVAGADTARAGRIGAAVVVALWLALLALAASWLASWWAGSAG